MTDYLPPWLDTALKLLLGAGGVALLKVWLENRRLGKKDFRETLLARITQLEKTSADQNERIGGLRVEVAVLSEENRRLKEARREAERDPQGSGDAD